MNRPALEEAVRPRKVDHFERTDFFVRGHQEPERLDAFFGNVKAVARRELRHVVGAEDVEGAGFRRKIDRGAFLAEIQRPKSHRVPDGGDAVIEEKDERIGAFDAEKYLLNFFDRGHIAGADDPMKDYLGYLKR